MDVSIFVYKPDVSNNELDFSKIPPRWPVPMSIDAEPLLRDDEFAWTEFMRNQHIFSGLDRSAQCIWPDGFFYPCSQKVTEKSLRLWDHALHILYFFVARSQLSFIYVLRPTWPKPRGHSEMSSKSLECPVDSHEFRYLTNAVGIPAQIDTFTHLHFFLWYNGTLSGYTLVLILHLKFGLGSNLSSHLSIFLSDRPARERHENGGENGTHVSREGDSFENQGHSGERSGLISKKRQNSERGRTPIICHIVRPGFSSDG